jgi:hypothetical protein
MRRLLVVIVVLLLPLSAFGEDLYIAQSDAGLIDGSSCANAHSAAWFNTAGNWGAGAGLISAGDTAHFCATITTGLMAKADGSAGNPITLLFESGALLSQPVCSATVGCLNVSGRNYIIVDGGANGVIENSNNGTSPTYANQAISIGLAAIPCSHCEIKNLTIQNIYVHLVDLNDTAVSYNQNHSIKFAGSNTTIHHNTFHDAGWCLYQNWQNGDTAVEIHHNEFYHCSHGWTVAASGVVSASNFKFYNNHIHDYSNWDTTANTYHHDGIHAFGISGAVGDAYDIYNNLFEGACGDHMTGHIYMEGITGTQWTNTGTVRIFNNVLHCDSTVFGILRVDIGHGEIYNNTITGPGSTGVCFDFLKVINGLFKNNAVEGCKTLISIDSITTIANPATDFNYNTYGICTTANCWKWSTVAPFTNNLSTWQTNCACDGNSSKNANLSLDESWYPLTGSPVIGAGTDLSSLGISTLNTDKLGQLRQAGSAWGTGAYEFGASRRFAPRMSLRRAAVEPNLFLVSQ